jgi:Tol biopolymer transport system component
MGSETGDIDVWRTPAVPALPPLTAATGVAEDNELLENEPAVSPDGKTVAFVQRPLGMPFGQADIYAVGIDGGPTSMLFATAESETSPAYSPDGTKVVFDSGGTPLVGNADGSGTPVPLNVGTLAAVGRFDWVPKQAEPSI